MIENEVVSSSQQECSRNVRGKGKIMAIGIGPGNLDNMTLRCVKGIETAEMIVGYHVYVSCVRPLLTHQEVFENGMGNEVARCKVAVEAALEGKIVGVVCSGDASLYAMAGLLFELVEKAGGFDLLDIEVIPGMTAATYCSSVLGAAIVEDFCTISLSDYMTPLDKIMKRVDLAGAADFTIALYNPRSLKRPEYLAQALNILRMHRLPSTPVGIVQNGNRVDEKITLTTLEQIDETLVDMFCTVIIGNSQTKQIDRFMVTSRGYVCG